jgi:hypothetical protein
MSVVKVPLINCQRRVSKYTNGINNVPWYSLNPTSSQIVNVYDILTQWSRNKSHILRILAKYSAH